MSESVIFFLIIAIVVADFVFEQLLDLMNYRSLGGKLPGEMNDVFDQEQYDKSIRYQKVRSQFSFLTSGISFLVILGLLYFGFFGWLDGALRPYFGDTIFLSLAFFALLFIASDVLTLPFQWYSTFVIEERFGFNKSTPGIFISDKLKGYGLSLILGGGIGYLFFQLIEWLGPGFWWIFWIVISAFTLFMNMFYTSLIVPLFNKLTPMENGNLKEAIEKYARSVRFPLDNIYVIDGSKRSAKSNAYFSGIGKKKKIVLYDTLIENHSDEELVSVLAHEVGHYKKNHIYWGLVLSIIQTGIILFIMSTLIFNPELSMALGGEISAVHLNLIAFVLLFTPISKVTGLFLNVLSRKNEYEADAFATKTYNGEELIKALKKLSSDNLSNLTPNRLFVFFHYSHPPVLNRVEAIREYTRKLQ
jgi:STE24 endopeptidase